MLTGVNYVRLVQNEVKSLPYILVVRKEPVSLKCQKEINQLKVNKVITVNLFKASVVHTV